MHNRTLFPPSNCASYLFAVSKSKLGGVVNSRKQCQIFILCNLNLYSYNLTMKLWDLTLKDKTCPSQKKKGIICDQSLIILKKMWEINPCVWTKIRMRGAAEMTLWPAAIWCLGCEKLCAEKWYLLEYFSIVKVKNFVSYGEDVVVNLGPASTWDLHVLGIEGNVITATKLVHCC